MRTLRKIGFVVLILLANTAGIPKVLRVEDEVEFFQGLGLDDNLLVAFGVIQIVCGLLLFPKKTRLWGAAGTGLMFLASTIMIFLSGNVGFGLVSILPVLLAVNVVEEHLRRRPLRGSGQTSRPD